MEEHFEQVKKLFQLCFEMYYQISCQCAYPRYHSIVSIDCVDTGDSFSCYETEMLIELSKPYFDIQKGPPGFEGSKQTWLCKKCKSTFSLDWSDFSIHVNRQTLKPESLRTPIIGKEAVKPLPLFLGLSGHSFPPRTEMAPVTFEQLENYLLEK